MLTIKSLQIESRVGFGNVDGFTYKSLLVPSRGGLGQGLIISI